MDHISELWYMQCATNNIELARRLCEILIPFIFNIAYSVRAGGIWYILVRANKILLMKFSIQIL